jgi:23S rRNA (uridine2552-2'-O)-methyltransferase
MSGKDDYYNRAKQQGYRSRAAYKLKQLDELEDVLSDGDTVVDLGAAPGGWLQVAKERVGTGRVLGVDFQRIDPIEGVETIKGDMTEESTRERIAEEIGEADGAATAASPERAGGHADVVLSDMAPNMTGEYSLDQARSVHLARQAFETARDVLAPGGDFVVKVFEGRDLEEFRDDLEEHFEYVRTTSPKASRKESSEVYLIAKGFLTAPVSEGDRLTVEIEDEGREGDGIARTEGYTVFVPGTEKGDRVEIEIEDVKPRFGFANRVE